MGFGKFDPSIRPISKLAQKQAIFDMYVRDVIREHQPRLMGHEWLSWRGPVVVAGTMPYSVLVIFFPLGFLACKCSSRWVVAGVLPVFVVLYAISVVFQVLASPF